MVSQTFGPSPIDRVGACISRRGRLNAAFRCSPTGLRPKVGIEVVPWSLGVHP